MNLLTVGTSFPFDRLVQAVDEAIGRGEIQGEFFAQVGIGGYRPRHMEAVEILEKTEFDRHLRQCTYVISHAGMGTITMALEHGKPLLAMPRRKAHRELVNDHQLETARKFEELGHIVVAYEPAELPAKYALLRDFSPRPRESQAAQVADRIARFIDEVAAARAGAPQRRSGC